MSQQNITNRSDTLRALADLLEQHPEIEAPYIDTHETEITKIRFQLTSHGDSAAATAAAVMKAFPGTFTKGYVGEYFILSGEFAGVPVEINAKRGDVCVATQVGTKTVKQHDPEALKLVPEIEVEVPVYEYDCKPILGGAA